MFDSPFHKYSLHVRWTAAVDPFSLFRKDCRHVPQSQHDGLLVFLRDEDGAEHGVDLLRQRPCPAFETGIGCIHREKPVRIIMCQAACPETGKGDGAEDKADDADLYRVGGHLAGSVEQCPLQCPSVVGIDVVGKAVFETGDDFAVFLRVCRYQSFFFVDPADVHVFRHGILSVADAKMLHPVQVVFVCDFSYVMAFCLEGPGEFGQHFRFHASSIQLCTTKVKKKMPESENCLPRRESGLKTDFWVCVITS